MFTILLCICLVTATSAGTESRVYYLKEDVSGSWSLSHFAEMVRGAIQVPFPWETVESTLDKDTQVDISHLAEEMITHELPLLIPACIGLVLAVLVPIFTLLFCCCRCCCGCCGGKLTVQNVGKHKWNFMFINSCVIVILVGFLSAMACCMPISGNRLLTSPRLMFRVISASLDDIADFFDNFVKDTSDLALDVLDTTVGDIKKNLDDLPDTLSDPVTDGARPIVDEIESKINIISSEIDALRVAEAEIKTTVNAMIKYSNDLQSGITNINGLYATIKTECKDDGKTFCDSLPDSTGPDALDISIDNSKLTVIVNEVSAVITEANKVNLTQYSTLGDTTFKEVPKTIKDASQSAVDMVKATLDTVHDDMKPEIDTALKSAKFDMDFSDTLDPFDETISLLESNTATIGSVFAVLGCIFFTIGMVAFVGMMLGILCTKKPTSIMETGRTKAGSCGACLLMTSVGLAVFPLILNLLLGSILMLLGGNFTILCAPLEDLTVLKRLVDSGLLFGGENLGEKFFNDSSLDLSVTNLFKTCRNDGTLYSGLNLGTIMNLSTLFSVDEFVPDLGDSVVMQINDTIKDISIVDVSSFNDLKASLDLPNIDRDTAREIEDELNAIDLEGKSKEMSALADTIPDKVYADKYKTLSIALQDMHDDQKVPLLQCVNDLTTILNGMDSRSQTIKVVVTELSNDLQSLTNYVRDNAANVVLEVLNDFLDGMKTVPETLIGSVTDALSTDIGRCKTLADVYDTVIGSICTHFLDSFNVLWASFYTSGWLIIVLMISSCTLSKYFRIPCDIVYADQLQDTTYNGHPSPNSAKVDLIHYKKLADGKNTHGENADGENADGKNAHPSPNSAKVDLIHYKKLADGKKADGKNADGENADGKNADGKNAGENADGKNADGENADGTNVDGENADGTNVDGENADGKNASNKSNNASKRNYQRLHQKWRHRRRLITGPFTAQFFAEKMQGKSSAETIFITDSKQGINDNKPMCTVVELDDSSKDSAWCSQSLSSFEGTSGQDVINSQDIDQKLSDPHNKVDSTWVDIEESNDLNIADKSPIDCTKFDERVKDDWQFTPEIKDFPYFQLHDDEFILLPLTRMLAESEENINEKKTIVNNNIQNNKDLVTSEEIGCTDNEEKEMSKWLNTYIIQSNSEQIASSPLVKYSSDNEMHFKQSLKVNKNHYENTVVGNTSSCQVKESNDDKNVDVEMNGSKWYVDTSKPLSQNKDRENIDETEHPVQEVVCALCKSVGIKNRKRRYSGMMEITSISSNTIEKAENDKAMKTVNIAKDDSSKTNDNFVSNFWTADQIKQLNKSFENSFQAFDDTLGNMSGEVVNDQKKRLVNSVSRPVNVMTKHTSHQKIDVNVRPYKPVKTTLSPQAAFNFWKYIEANCSCPSEIPDSLSQRKQHHSSSLHTFIDKETNVKCYAENVELLTGGYHNEQNKKLYQDGPDSLVNLAINASRLAYIPEHLNTMERQRKEQKTYTRKDGQKQELRCEVASTRKDNIKVSYL